MTGEDTALALRELPGSAVPGEPDREAVVGAVTLSPAPRPVAAPLVSLLGSIRRDLGNGAAVAASGESCRRCGVSSSPIYLSNRGHV
jgi:hypothetical protein